MSQLSYSDPHGNLEETKPYNHFYYDSYLNNSKLVKHYCDGKCKTHPEHDKRKLIRNAYQLGFKRCKQCGYFKTKKRNCPCCKITLRCTMRQKNHPNRKNPPVFKEYE